MSPVSDRLFPHAKNVTSNVVIFEHAQESVLLIHTPHYSILSLCEGLGGFALLLVFLGKCFVGGIERRMLEADLVQYFYQIEKKTKSYFNDFEEREKAQGKIGKVKDADLSSRMPLTSSGKFKGKGSV